MPRSTLYIDTSGSMPSDILKMVHNDKDKLGPTVGFSHVLCEEWEPYAWGGSEIKCVEDHAIANGIDEIFVFTDGFLYLLAELKITLVTFSEIFHQINHITYKDFLGRCARYES